jgi:GGDEF domain-containing protein
MAFHEAANLQDTHYIVVAVLSKLQAVNQRFGYTVGDEVLCEFAARVAGNLCNDAQFYRWNGPTLVAVLKRDDPCTCCAHTSAGC